MDESRDSRREQCRALELERLKMPDPFDLCGIRPQPLVPKDCVLPITERIRADGSVATPLERDSVTRAVRQANWKLRWQYKPYGKEAWELFDLATDPGERNDLAAEDPERVQALARIWDEYAQTNNVILPSRSPYEGLEKNMPQRFPVTDGYPPLFYKRQFVPPPELTGRSGGGE